MKKCNLHCGSCLNLDREKAPTLEKKCSELGRVATSKPCSSYVPNMFSLVGNEKKEDRVESIAEGMRGLSTTELEALAGVMLAEKKTRAAGWTFWQKVYVRYQGSADRNYLSNFAVGHILYADREFVRVSGDSGKTFMTLVNEKNGETLYTVERFAAIRKQLRAENKFIDARLDQEKMVAASRQGHVATMDEVLEADRASKKLPVSSGRKDDLVSIVSRMARGVLVTNRTKKKKSTKPLDSGIDQITIKG